MRKSIFSLLLLVIILTGFSLEPALGQDDSCGGTRLDALDIEWNPQGTQFAIGGCFGVKIYDTQLQLLQEINVDAAHKLSWHPYEPLLAIGTDTQIIVWNVDQAQPVEVLPGRVFALWNRAGTQIVFTNYERDTLILYDWQQQANVAELNLEYTGVSDGIWSENDHRLIFISWDLSVWNLENNQISSFALLGTRMYLSWARPGNIWLNNGQSVVMATGEELLDKIVIWDFVNEQTIMRDFFPTQAILLTPFGIGVSVSPNSMYIAFSELNRVTILDSSSLEVVTQLDTSSSLMIVETYYQDICPDTLSEDYYQDKVSWFPNGNDLLVVGLCRLAVVPISLPN